jgi:hypothetical protein
MGCNAKKTNINIPEKHRSYLHRGGSLKSRAHFACSQYSNIDNSIRERIDKRTLWSDYRRTLIDWTSFTMQETAVEEK